MQKSGLSYLAIDRNVEASFDVLNALVRGVVLPLRYKRSLSICEEDDEYDDSMYQVGTCRFRQQGNAISLSGEDEGRADAADFEGGVGRGFQLERHV